MTQGQIGATDQIVVASSGIAITMLRTTTLAKRNHNKKETLIGCQTSEVFHSSRSAVAMEHGKGERLPTNRTSGGNPFEVGLFSF